MIIKYWHKHDCSVILTIPIQYNQKYDMMIEISDFSFNLSNFQFSPQYEKVK